MTMTRPMVLLLGGTGRTGRCVLDQLTQRGVSVRAIVRSRDKVPTALRERPGVELVEASLLDLDDEALAQQLRGVDVVISCLGHVLNLRGIFGAPRDLVTRAVARVTAAVRTLGAPRPVRLVLMSSVSVNGPRSVDSRRGAFERAVIALICALTPPARDNQTAADFLREQVGSDDPRLEWVVVRPDALIEGERSAYALHEGLVDGLFSPGQTTMNNIGSFMADLATDDAAWTRWRARLPVIVNERAPQRAGVAA